MCALDQVILRARPRRQIFVIRHGQHDQRQLGNSAAQEDYSVQADGIRQPEVHEENIRDVLRKVVQGLRQGFAMNELEPRFRDFREGLPQEAGVSWVVLD